MASTHVVTDRAFARLPSKPGETFEQKKFRYMVLMEDEDGWPLFVYTGPDDEIPEDENLPAAFLFKKGDSTGEAYLTLKEEAKEDALKRMNTLGTHQPETREDAEHEFADRFADLKKLKGLELHGNDLVASDIDKQEETVAAIYKDHPELSHAAKTIDTELKRSNKETDRENATEERLSEYLDVSPVARDAYMSLMSMPRDTLLNITEPDFEHIEFERGSSKIKGHYVTGKKDGTMQGTLSITDEHGVRTDHKISQWMYEALRDGQDKPASLYHSIKSSGGAKDKTAIESRWKQINDLLNRIRKVTNHPFETDREANPNWLRSAVATDATNKNIKVQKKKKKRAE